MHKVQNPQISYMQIIFKHQEKKMFRYVWKLKDTKRAQFHLSSGKSKLKPQCDTHQND